jgi:hypothetical protein
MLQNVIILVFTALASSFLWWRSRFKICRRCRSRIRRWASVCNVCGIREVFDLYKVSDELIICNNCFSAIKAVGRYGQVNLLSGSRKQVQKWNPRHCRTWVLCKVFSRDSRMPSPTSRQSCVANHLTDNIRFRPNLLSDKQFWISAWALRDTVHGFR